VTVARCHPAWLAIFNLLGVRLRVDVSAVANDRAHKSIQILERMKLRLSGKAKRRPRIPEINRRALDELHIVQPCAMRCIELTLELIAFVIAAEEEVSVHSLKVAVEIFQRRNRLNAINCGRVTLGSETRSVDAVELLYLVVSVVERSGEMCGCTTSLAAPHRTVVDYDDSLAGAAEVICR
jgi:hypothetical protein